MKQVWIIDQFFKDSKKLRSSFEKRFNKPLNTTSDRFVWDYWYVKNQYNLIRTPAYHFFQKDMYQKFHDFLVQWGQKNLGCHNISPPWLSYYVEGCGQELHADVPHGPWAYVLSLTINPKLFQGGETILLKPSTLSYWNHHNFQMGLEQEHLVQKISPKFNRLIIFDPRVPHGVTRVSGTRDPLNARLVIHGWFVEPKPFVKGPLSRGSTDERLNELTQNIAQDFSNLPEFQGTLTLKLMVSASGLVNDFQVLTNTLLTRDAKEYRNSALSKLILPHIAKLKFPKKNQGSEIVLPLLFNS